MKLIGAGAVALGQTVGPEMSSNPTPGPEFSVTLGSLAPIRPPFYPIVYVRGYAMRSSEREDTFYDAYYGFAATSVEKREAQPKDQYFAVDVFEGQLIRFMKTNAYVDSSNRGLSDATDPTRSLWVCRFYDQDVFLGKIRPILEHAEDLRTLVCDTIPTRLTGLGVNLGTANRDYRVILIAHSMGGLVCRALIQNLLPSRGDDPKRWIHRFVTLGTPHRGIDLGNVPAFLQDAVETVLNPFDSRIFQPAEIKAYLKLEPPAAFDAHSLGDPTSPTAFPVSRCLCLIGSDYKSYSAAQLATGSVSDGLVKQTNAYIVAGPRPADGSEYPDAKRAFWANVHRAHSGTRGIVNSYESYENIQRFLFGDIKADLYLDGCIVTGAQLQGYTYVYDVEFALTIRGTGVYLHRRQQDPCENAIRSTGTLPSRLKLHTLFLNSKLRPTSDRFSNFLLRFRIVERRVKQGLLWDHEYPDRPIYSESLEARIDLTGAQGQLPALEYRWLADAGDYQQAASNKDQYRIPLRAAPSFSGSLTVEASSWPDPTLTED